MRRIGQSLIVLSLLTTPLVFAEVPVEDANQSATVVNGNDWGSSAENANTTQPVEQEAPARAVNTANLTETQRLAKLESQMNNQIQMNLQNQVQTLQQQLQDVRGQLEVAMHDLKQLQTQQQTMYQDLDGRLAKSSSLKSSSVAKVSEQATDKSSDAATDKAQPKTSLKSANVSADNSKQLLQEHDLYQVAYEKIKNRNYAQAIKAFQNYLQKYPQGKLAANAHFWLGELYLLQNSNVLALNEFNALAKSFPQSPKAREALLKIGQIYKDEGDSEKANVYFAKAKKLAAD